VAQLISPSRIKVIDQPAKGSLRSLFLRGSASLGVAIVLERMFGFLSSMLAARLGGPRTFGAYAIVLATAGTIAAYAGAGIGTTANRFSGQYPREHRGYRGYLRALVIVSLLSAILSASLMFVGARPLATLIIRNPNLTTFLRIAALSSAMLVLAECCRGLFIGQQKFGALLMLSLVSGLGLLIVLPLAATIGPGAMVAGQGCVALVAVLGCVTFSRQLRLNPIHAKDDGSGPGLRPVFRFGMVQFSAVAGINIASWWIASLVARSDVLMVQMGIYAVANQVRGLASVGPGIFTQVGYSLLTDESAQAYGGANRVMLANTFMTTSLAVLIAGLVMAVTPQLLLFTYGESYRAGELAVIILLATAIIHMGSTPAAHRLTIVALRAAGIINTIWAILIMLIGTALIPTTGAKGAATAFLVAHASTSVMVALTLSHLKKMPRYYLPMFVAAMGGALVLAGLGYLRASMPAHALLFTLSMLIVWIVLLLALGYVGLKLKCIPSQICRILRLNEVVQVTQERHWVPTE
jgi:O-antigen/teichoic acid export membrane protein